MVFLAYTLQGESPTAAKRYVASVTLAGIVQILAPFWADKARSATPDGNKVSAFLRNVVSSVCSLPPEGDLILPGLDQRLLPAFSSLCASESCLSRRYPEVAGVAERMNKTMPELCLLAGDLKVDVSGCESKGEVVQARLWSGKVLVQQEPVPTSVSATPAGSSQALGESEIHLTWKYFADLLVGYGFPTKLWIIYSLAVFPTTYLYI